MRKKFSNKEKAEFVRRANNALVQRKCIICLKDVEVTEPIKIPEHLKKVPISEKCEVIEKNGEKYLRRFSDICRGHQIEFTQELTKPEGKSMIELYFQYKTL